MNRDRNSCLEARRNKNTILGIVSESPNVPQENVAGSGAKMIVRRPEVCRKSKAKNHPVTCQTPSGNFS